MGASWSDSAWFWLVRLGSTEWAEVIEMESGPGG